LKENISYKATTFSKERKFSKIIKRGEKSLFHKIGFMEEGSGKNSKKKSSFSI